MTEQAAHHTLSSVAGRSWTKDVSSPTKMRLIVAVDFGLAGD